MNGETLITIGFFVSFAVSLVFSYGWGWQNGHDAVCVNRTHKPPEEGPPPTDLLWR
jgi:hypothetical protein